MRLTGRAGSVWYPMLAAVPNIQVYHAGEASGRRTWTHLAALTGAVGVVPVGLLEAAVSLGQG